MKMHFCETRQNSTEADLSGSASNYSVRSSTICPDVYEKCNPANRGSVTCADSITSIKTVNIPSACRIANIDPNDALILPHDANLRRMTFSKRTTGFSCADSTR
jgi:hypothetical protein